MEDSISARVDKLIGKFPGMAPIKASGGRVPDWRIPIDTDGLTEKDYIKYLERKESVNRRRGL